jgi:hypothetical protein
MVPCMRKRGQATFLTLNLFYIKSSLPPLCSIDFIYVFENRPQEFCSHYLKSSLSPLLVPALLVINGRQFTRRHSFLVRYREDDPVKF